MSKSPDPPPVYGDKVPPAAIRKLLENPEFCSRISGAWPQIRILLIEVQANLAGFTTAHALEAGPTVLAANAILKTFEVSHDQAERNKHHAEKIKAP